MVEEAKRGSLNISRMICLLSLEHQRVVESLVRDLIKLECMERSSDNQLVHSKKGELNGINSPLITPRQAEILSYIVQGYLNKQIATQLGITEGVVKKHVSSAMKTLKANSRTQAVIKALEIGLITEGDGYGGGLEGVCPPVRGKDVTGDVPEERQRIIEAVTPSKASTSV